MTKGECAKLVAIVAASYPSLQWETPTLEQWIAELADLPLDRAHAAVREMVRTLPAWPSIAYIRRAVLCAGLPEAHELAHLAQVGDDRHPAVREIIAACGGSYALKTMSAERSSRMAMQVAERVYAVWSKRLAAADAPPQVVGKPNLRQIK